MIRKIETTEELLVGSSRNWTKYRPLMSFQFDELEQYHWVETGGNYGCLRVDIGDGDYGHFIDNIPEDVIIGFAEYLKGTL
jgi:hypothetical protein